MEETNLPTLQEGDFIEISSPFQVGDLIKYKDNAGGFHYNVIQLMTIKCPTSFTTRLGPVSFRYWLKSERYRTVDHEDIICVVKKAGEIE